MNRGELRENRQTVANDVRRWLERTAGLVDALDQHTKEEWNTLSNPRQSHKIVVRHVLTQKNWPELAAEDRRRFQQDRRSLPE